MKEVYFGFKMSKYLFNQEYSGLEDFNFDAYIIHEKGNHQSHAEYEILSRTVYKMNDGPIRDLLEIMESIQDKGYEAIVRFVNETDSDWIYYKYEDGERIEIRRLIE